MTLKSILSRRRTAAVLGGGLCLLLGVLLLALSFSAGTPAQTDAAVPYGENAQEGDLVYIEPMYMTESFASFTALESDQFYFMLSPDLDVWMVCISDADAARYLPLQDFTYSDAAPEPEIPEVTGVCVPMDEELLPLGAEALNILFGEEVTTEDGLTELTGAFYIDTTASAPSSPAAPLLLIGGVLMLLAAAWLFWRRLSYARVCRSTLSALDGGLTQQLDEPETLFWPAAGLYLTRNYLAGTTDGLRAVPLTALKGVRGLLSGRKALLCADDRGGVAHILCRGARSGKLTEDLRACVAELSRRQPGLEYGANRRVLTEEADVGGMDDFYAIDEKSDLRVRESLDENGIPLKPNYALGLLGALLGAVLGGALWVGVGMLGYVSGLVGGVMIWLALKGFQKLAGVLTKGGAIAAAALAVLAIPAANYVVYALTYADAMGDRYGLGRALVETWSVMRENGWVGSYLKDLGLGLLFSALVGWPMLKAAFAPAPEHLVVSGATVVAAELPKEPAAGSVHTLRPAKGFTIVGLIACFLGAALFLFLATMLVVSGEEGVLGTMLLCLLFAAGFIVGAAALLSARKAYIEYDAAGVRLYKGRKSVDLPWGQVTELRLRNASRLRIIGPAGKIGFDMGWTGWEQLMIYARNHAGNADEL